MADYRKILLLDAGFNLRRLEALEGQAHEAVIALFWMAPSTQKYLSQKVQAPCYGLPELIKNEEAWGRKAYEFITPFIHSGPRYASLAWRSYLAEPLYHEACMVHLLLQTVEWVARLKETWSVSRVLIEGTLPESMSLLFGQFLSKDPGLIYRPWSASFAERDVVPLRRKFRERFQEAMLMGCWKKQWADLREWMDPTYRKRILCRKWRRTGAISKGGTTFFSSYQNNSQILSSFTQWFSGPVTWVLTNDSARRGISCKSASYVWVWNYGSSSRSGLRAMDEDSFSGKGERPDSVALFGSWLRQSPTWKRWRSAEHALLANLTRCWEEYLDRTQPRLVVMANQWGIEGWFTNVARRRGIPVLQIMHGALGGHLYTRTPIISDALVVSGNFWRDLWAEDQRPRILAANPEDWFQKNPKRSSAGRRSLTYFSWPLSQACSYGARELIDGFIDLFHKLVRRKHCEIIVRFHPRENPADFVLRWRFLRGPLPQEIRLHKNEPLAETVGATDVALMFRSTVMLHCLASGIPLVVPGWIDFGWNSALRRLPNVYLAADFPDLEKKITEWLEEPPPSNEERTQEFLVPPGSGREEFRSALELLMGR